MGSGELVSKLFGTYYLKKTRHDSTVLHYKRNPTWRSLVLFLVFFFLTHVISTQAEYPYLGAVCYLLGVYFSYIATEKYEECIFDKSKGTVTMMNSRFFERHVLGYRKKIVTELGEIAGVKVESQKILFAVGHMVVLKFVSGLSLSITVQCTYGDKSEHEAIAEEIRKFLESEAQEEEGGAREEEGGGDSGQKPTEEEKKKQ